MQTDPVQDYVRGWVPFLDCKIFLDSRPLIPRLETEYWVEKAISDIRSKIQDTRYQILDLFAGSGAIGVAILKHLPNVHVDFGEIEAAHLPTILKNVRENGVDERRAQVIETDVWSNISGSYDAVLANPPYISKNLAGRVQESVLAHEPESALFADEDGFALIRKTIEGALAHLAPGGILYIEHEPEQAQAIQEAGQVQGLAVKTLQDQFGVLRYSSLTPVA